MSSLYLCMICNMHVCMCWLINNIEEARRKWMNFITGIRIFRNRWKYNKYYDGTVLVNPVIFFNPYRTKTWIHSSGMKAREADSTVLLTEYITMQCCGQLEVWGKYFKWMYFEFQWHSSVLHFYCCVFFFSFLPSNPILWFWLPIQHVYKRKKIEKKTITAFKRYDLRQYVVEKNFRKNEKQIKSGTNRTKQKRINILRVESSISGKFHWTIDTMNIG